MNRMDANGFFFYVCVCVSSSLLFCSANGNGLHRAGSKQLHFYTVLSFFCLFVFLDFTFTADDLFFFAFNGLFL